MSAPSLLRSSIQRRHLLLPRLFSSGASETRQAWNPAQPSAPLDTDSEGSTPQHLNADEHSSPDALPPTLRQVYRCLLEMGHKPGINCVVGDGLATVPIGLFMNNKKVALELDSQQEAVFQPGRSGSSYVQSRVHEATLRAHDWKMAKVSEQRWKLLTEYGYSASGKPPADPETNPTPVLMRLHTQYLKDILSEASKDEGGHAHQHHDGCCGGSH